MPKDSDIAQAELDRFELQPSKLDEELLSMQGALKEGGYPKLTREEVELALGTVK